ncbi:MAG TPA: hypothetical protein VJV78_11255 [Polyangiales bacterium]|nr:hypothetical protein [Polyangiales bacterium]
MRALSLLIATCLLACAGEDNRSVAETYDYLLTPAGQRFRVMGAGPLRRGANSRMGLRIKYLAQAQTKDELLAHADTLVAALGPELQLTGERNLVVRAQLGPTTLALDPSGKDFYDLEYRLEAAGFVRVQEEDPNKRYGAVNAPDDVTFPYRAAQLTEAGRLGAGWLGSLDREDMLSLRAELTDNFREQVSDDARFRELLLQRKNSGLPGTRRELYRMQQRVAGRTAGDDVLLVYECSMPRRPGVLERVMLARDADAWQVSGYVFQPVPQLEQ